MPETQTPVVEEVFIGINIIARIHPGDRDAITEQIEQMLCPFGHFEQAGDQPSEHECRIDMIGSTTHKDLSKVFQWMDSEAPE